MTHNFFEHQAKIQAKITEVLTEARSTFTQFPMDEAIFEHLLAVSTKGKQFRGCLLTSFYATVGEKKYLESAIILAAAVELYGTALLIHDDIMDRSETRRGEVSTFKYFENLAEEQKLKDPAHFGISTAISVGDMLFFLAESMLYDLEIPDELKLKLSKISAKELLALGLAQVEDLRMAVSSDTFDQDAILKMYAGKTGRYTGRWPLELAATLAEIDQDVVTKVCQVGEEIGVLFQLKDDELGVFGDERVTGKSSTSDISEGKKTLYYLLLQEKISETETEAIFGVIGNADATQQQIDQVKEAIQIHGIFDHVHQIMNEKKEKIESDITSLEITTEGKRLLNQVCQVVLHRSK